MSKYVRTIMRPPILRPGSREPIIVWSFNSNFIAPEKESIQFIRFIFRELPSSICFLCHIRICTFFCTVGRVTGEIFIGRPNNIIVRLDIHHLRGMIQRDRTLDICTGWVFSFFSLRLFGGSPQEIDQFVFRNWTDDGRLFVTAVALRVPHEGPTWTRL